MSRLSESGKQSRIWYPVLVQRLEKPDELGRTHRLLDGRHRLEALKQIGAKEVDVIEVEESEKDAQIIALEVNTLSRPLRYIEIGERIRPMIDALPKKARVAYEKELAERLHISYHMLRRALAQARNISPRIKEKIFKGELDQLKDYHLEAITSLSHADQELIVEEIEKGDLSPSEIERVISSAKATLEIETETEAAGIGSAELESFSEGGEGEGEEVKSKGESISHIIAKVRESIAANPDLELRSPPIRPLPSEAPPRLIDLSAFRAFKQYTFIASGSVKCPKCGHKHEVSLEKPKLALRASSLDEFLESLKEEAKP